MFNKNALQAYFFLLLLTFVGVICFFVFKPYFPPIVFGGALALLFGPVYLRLLKVVRKPTVAAILSTILAVVLVLVPTILFGLQVVQEASQLYSGLNGDRSAIISWINDALHNFSPTLNISMVDFEKYLREGLSWLVGNLGGFFSSATSILVSLFISLLAFYYFLRDGGSLKEKFLILSPLKEEDDLAILDKIESAMSSVVRGTLIVSVLQGLLAMLGFWAFGLPQPVLWGLVTIVAALIPVVGTMIVTLPASVYLLLTADVVPGLGLLIWSLVVVSSIDNLVRPLLIKKGVEINALAILLSVIGGLSFFGPIGFILGPIFLSLLFTLLEMYPRILYGEGK